MLVFADAVRGRYIATLVGGIAVLSMTGLSAWGASRFTDDDGNIHEGNIEAVAADGITKGCNPPENTLYCPTDPVTRGQMAAFLRRAFTLPASAQDWFMDDDDSIFEGDNNALADAGITKGCNPPANNKFCPDGLVTRGQMAAFLRRAFALPSSNTDLFVDDDGSVFEADINSIAAGGITKGCNPPANDRYCPDDLVLRDQMASFLARALGLEPVESQLGSEWRQVVEGAPTFEHTEEGVIDSSFTVEGLASNSELLVAGGYVRTTFSNDVTYFENYPSALIWYSTDGTSWEPASFHDPATGGSYRSAGGGVIHSVEAVDDGFVAVGCSESKVGGSWATVWTSSDGKAWERTWGETSPPASCMLDGSFEGDPGGGFAAVGWEESSSGRFEPRAWTPTFDGNWQKWAMPMPEWATADDDVRAAAVGTRPGFLGLVAAGYTFGGGDVAHGVVWHAVQGCCWAALPALALSAGHLQDVAGTTSEWIVAGSQTGYPTDDAGFTFDGGMWTSSVSDEWEEMSGPFGGEGNQTLESVATSDTGWVAVGHLDSQRPLAWFSPDGENWRAGSGIRNAFDSGRMLDVVVHRGRAVAVGVRDDKGAVWVSPP